jgi:hypothetical protein
MTREEIVSVLGPTDATLVADILSTGASFEELGSEQEPFPQTR